ncbi:MAG: 7-cyano-7-deazaguanine synthase QueC [Candidatus Omnitrophica bacterium]|nr:7-cyano-7-deazaguanine synthase QueC [Candidatus Omnitrophota bacterium]
MIKSKKKAVVLLSGGLDSAVALYAAKAMGYKVHCLSFEYGQRHEKELRSAKKIARCSSSPWMLARFSLPWKGSSLIDKNMQVPAKGDFLKSIPTTYVPGRNIIFLSFAASFAERINAEAVFIGANEIDFSGYPDCRQGFLKTFQTALNQGTKQGVEGKKIKICYPLVKKNKAQIIKMAKRLKVPLELTWSCYHGKAKPCGICDSCRLRELGFKAAKMKDPAL